jgi:malonate transporter and related proteins
MLLTIAFKLAGVFGVVALGWMLGQRGWLALSPGAPASARRAARALSNLVFMALLPALLFRTAARIDLAALPWAALAAYFVPALALMAVVIAAWPRGPHVPAAEPAVRSVAAVFGNTAQLGIPVITALHGEAGLAVHLAIVSVHALVLLVAATVVAEVVQARARPRESAGRVGSAVRLLATIARQAVIHPVVLPVLAGLAWNAAGGTLAAPVDEVLRLAGVAALPLCLVLLGVSLADGGVGRLGGQDVLAVSGIKLLVLPALVWPVAALGFGLEGTPLAALVLAAALPSGVNALLFAQRYDAAVPATTATILASTLAYGLTVPAWAWALAHAG